MNRKIKIISILTIILILTLTTYQPVIFATKNIQKTQIKIKNYNDGIINQNIKELTQNQIKQLKQILIEYNQAIEEKNTKQIIKYKTWLKENQILNKNQIKTLTTIEEKQQQKNEQISSSHYFSAVGNGFMIFPAETQIFQWIKKQVEEQENIISAFALLIILITIFYIPVMLTTHLIPFRIAMPQSQVRLDSGKMKIGKQNIPPPTKVNLTSFTGITISTPNISTDNETEENNNNAFLFVKGYAKKIEIIEK